MKFNIYALSRLCCKEISWMFLFCCFSIQQSFAQCDYIPGQSLPFLNAGFDAANTNICYLVDGAGNIIQSDDSGDCDFSGVAFGNYSVYVLNACPNSAIDIVASPPTTLTHLNAAAADPLIGMAGPHDFTVCSPSLLTACEDGIISVNMQPDLNVDPDYTMFYALVCSNVPEGNATELVQEISIGGVSAAFTIPKNNSTTSESNCSVYAINYLTADATASAAIDAITVGSNWATVNPFGTECLELTSTPITVLASTDPTCPTPLPVEMTYFKGDCDENKQNRLEWATSSETDVSHFSVESSNDGENWQALGEVEPRGNSEGGAVYSFTDTRSSLSRYYRLVVVDLDGTTDLSDKIFVGCLQEDGFGITSIFPNPSEGIFTIAYEAQDRSPITYRLTDVLGRVIFQEVIIPNPGVNSKTVDFSNLSAAYYFVIMNNGKKQFVEKVVKKHK